MAQAGLNEDKTGGRKSRWTVPLMKSVFVLFYICYDLADLEMYEYFCNFVLTLF